MAQDTTTLLIDESGVLRYELPHVPPNYERRVRIHLGLLLGKITQDKHDELLSLNSTSRPSSGASAARRLAFARRLVSQRKFEQAVGILKKLDPGKDAAAVATLLGTCYLGLNKVDKAAECLDPVAGNQPSPPGLKLALGRLELARGNEEKAEKHLGEAFAESRKKTRILFHLGRLYEGKGQLDKAAAAYREALEAIYGEGP